MYCDIEMLQLDQTVHEVLLSNQVLFLSPPLEQARAEWIASFHHYISLLCTLPRITSSRFQVFADTSADGPKDYWDVLATLNADILCLPFAAIESKVAEAKAFVHQWLQYQALWDVSAADIFEKVGKDVGKWCQLLTDIKKARSAIDSVDEEKSFGPIVINHKQVSSNTNTVKT